MKMNNFLKQLELAAKIWAAAVAVNALLVTLNFGFNDGGAIPLILLLMVVFGGIFSIPCLVIVFFIIRLSATRVNGKWLFGCVMAGGIITTLIVLNAFLDEMMEGGDRELQKTIWITSVMAAIASVAVFYKSLLQWGKEYSPYEKV